MNEVVARAPGRVNLIGEHTDYNDGFVMPCAIGYYTQAAARATGDGRIVLRQAHDDKGPHEAAYDIAEIPVGRRHDWTDYARGVLVELQRAGVELKGAEFDIGGTLPIGAGLSSSASFEVAVALAALGIAGARMDRLELAKVCQRAEHEHVGIRSGIMDQYAVLFGKRDRAILLDTEALEARYLPVPQSCRVIICNTTANHRLAASEYNKRREQCEAAVAALRHWYPNLTSLRHLTLEELVAHEGQLDQVLFRRARHVVSEDKRVLAAAVALEANDPIRFGALMNASHNSLRDDYEVSGVELDTMVEIARRCRGIYGARMTGGGFGGCTVNLVAADFADTFSERVAREYKAATNVAPEVYDGTPADGASDS